MHLFNRDYPPHVNVGEVPMESGEPDIHGWAEVEQLKSLDLKSRGAVRVTSLPGDVLGCVTELVLGCLMQPTMEIRQFA